MEIKKILESGLLETYVLGIATEEEVDRVLLLKKQSPEFADALTRLELDMELLAQNMAVQPPTGIIEKIEKELNEIQLKERALKPIPEFDRSQHDSGEQNKRGQYIEVESQSNQMRINKAWRWIFAAVFILSKIFLATAIYFYLENRQAQEQIKELKLELHQKNAR